MGVVVKHITEPVPEILKVLPTLPPEVDEIIKMALAKDKNVRYANTIELAKALNLVAFGNEGNISFGTNAGLRSGIYKQPAENASARGKTGLIVAGIVLLVLVLGGFLLRNQLFAPGKGSSTEAPASTQAPILETVNSSFAPACGPNVPLPPPPEIKETNSTCAKKNPYVTIVVPDGATFEPLDPAGSCVSQKASDGKHILLCTGPGFLEYDLKVCVPPPPVAESDLGRCSEGSNFDAANQCCVAAPPGGAGCAIYKIKLKGCG
jgi:hypothetical protein